MNPIVNGVEFKSKSHLKKYVKNILAKTEVGNRVSPFDTAFLSDLVTHHPQRKQKVGVGIDYFLVSTCPTYKTKHFTIIRKDKSTTDFSYLSCIDGNSIRKDVLSAMRYAIKGQILEFKDRVLGYPDITCEITGTKLDKYNSHVDHKPPLTFMRTVDDWMGIFEFNYPDIKITPVKDNQTVCEMSNNSQLESWRDWHKMNTKLRLISIEANLSHVRKQLNERR